MSTITSSTNTLLRRYLNGAITAPEEAELERRARRDPVLADAMLGLQAAPDEDHVARVNRMTAHVRRAAEPNTLLRAGWSRTYWAAAAAVLLLLSSALIFLPRWMDLAPGDMAMQTETSAPAEDPLQNNDSRRSEPEPATELIAEEEADAGLAPPPPAPPARPRAETPKPAGRNPTAGAASPVAAAPARERTSEADVAAEEQDDIAGITSAAAAAPAPPPPARIKRAPLASPASKKKSDPVNELFLPDEDGNVPLVAGNYLEGLITDEDGSPVFDALVRQPGLPLGVRTDTNGLFRLSYDATTTLLIVSHPDYLVERIELANDRAEDLQISLEEIENRPGDDVLGWTQNAARSEVVFAKRPGYAAPREGYQALRRRIEKNRPEGVPPGKVRLNFLVNQDGTLTDFQFRGRPSRATMDYIGESLIKSSIWEINYGDGEEPVRVHFKVVFE